MATQAAEVVRRDADWYAVRIRQLWDRAFPSILEIGQQLVQARAALTDQSFLSMFDKGNENRLLFTPRTAYQFIRIAEDKRLVIHGSRLPPSWRTLYEITRLTDEELQQAVNGGLLRPEWQRHQVVAYRKQCRREQLNGKVERVHGRSITIQDHIDRGNRFSTFYVDPPWQYGNQATRASTGNHYDTMDTESIMALPVEAIAHDDAHLHLWTTNAFLPDAFRVMQAWGFVYKSCFVWVKPEMGIGNYWRVSHEFLMFGKRGNLPRNQDATSLPSWLSHSRIGHSRKPEAIRKLVEQMSPEPRIEGFARLVPPGWEAWGNELERTLGDDGF